MCLPTTPRPAQVRAWSRLSNRLGEEGNAVAGQVQAWEPLPTPATTLACSGAWARHKPPLASVSVAGKQAIDTLLQLPRGLCRDHAIAVMLVPLHNKRYVVGLQAWWTQGPSPWQVQVALPLAASPARLAPDSDKLPLTSRATKPCSHLCFSKSGLPEQRPNKDGCALSPSKRHTSVHLVAPKRVHCSCVEFRRCL